MRRGTTSARIRILDVPDALAGYTVNMIQSVGLPKGCKVEIDHPEPPPLLDRNPRLEKAAAKLDYLTDELDDLASDFNLSLTDDDTVKEMYSTLNKLGQASVNMAKHLDRVNDVIAVVAAELNAAK